PELSPGVMNPVAVEFVSYESRLTPPQHCGNGLTQVQSYPLLLRIWQCTTTISQLKLHACAKLPICGPSFPLSIWRPQPRSTSSFVAWPNSLVPRAQQLHCAKARMCFAEPALAMPRTWE